MIDLDARYDLVCDLLAMWNAYAGRATDRDEINAFVCEYSKEIDGTLRRFITTNKGD